MGALLRFGPFNLDAEQLTLDVQGERLHLAPKVVQTLAILVERAGALVTKDELMDLLWPQGFVEEGNLTQNIYVLRRTLHAHGLERAIENVPRRGYRFVSPVRTFEPGRKAALPRWRKAIGLIAAGSLVLTLFTIPLPRGPEKSSLGPDGAQLYGMGRYYWSLRSTSGLIRALSYFKEVVRRYPRSALGYAGLADTYTEMYDYVCDGAPCAPTIAKARSYALKALAADPASSEAHTSVAMAARLFEHNMTKSDFEFQRAIALDPNNALAHEWYGNSLLARADIVRARIELQKAAVLQPVSVATYAWLARDAYYARRYLEAIANAREALALNPRRVETTLILGLALEQNGDEVGAVRVFQRLANLTSSPKGARVLIAGARARAGDGGRALRGLRNSSAFANDIALGFVTAGDYTRALKWLRTAHFSSQMERLFFAMDPRLDAVRGDNRFKEWTTFQQ